MDGIAILCRSFIDAVRPDGRVHLELADGQCLDGRLRETLRKRTGVSLCGRTLDLEAAYKQMLVKQSSLWASNLVVSKGQGKKAFCQSTVLLFGASASVKYIRLTGCPELYNCLEPGSLA